jgi:cystathionine beta-lyase/cystathionine gamma-synthase
VTEQTVGRDTLAVHAGEPHPRVSGSVVPPIFPSTTYEYGGEASYDEVRYTRLSNTPNHEMVGKKIAALEGAEAGLVTASGMSAISSALLALVGPGEHLLAQVDLYGGTHHFLTDFFPKLGRTVTFVPTQDPQALERHFRPATKAVYSESVSNPLLEIPDLPAVTAFARKKGIVSLIDNTFPSPVNFNPIEMGYDVVLHSATKYLNGHTDVIAGAVAGKASLVKAVHLYLNHMGGTLDAHSCFLLNRGTKTLGVRVKAQGESALKLAAALEKHPKISRVIYPGLPSHPHHARAREWFRGFGGMLSFEYTGNISALDAGLRKMRYVALAASLGGVESLVTRPATTSHSGMSREERERLGIKDALVRVSVGLEDAADLIADFNQALG